MHDEQEMVRAMTGFNGGPIESPGASIGDIKRAPWKQGDPTPRLNAALARAQGAMPNAARDSENPAFSRPGKKSTYADLTAAFDAARPALSANELAWTQDPACDDKGVTVTTTLLHSSGEERPFCYWLPVAKKDAHGYGATTTYARRFGFMAAVGLAPEDDDGNEASGRTPGEMERQMVATVNAELAERAAGIKKLVAAFDKLGITTEQLAIQLGHPVESINNDEWAKLRKSYAELEKLAKDPDEANRQEVKRQAEESLAQADAKRTVPQTEAQMTKALAASIFAGLVDKIRAAKTEADVLLIGATFPTSGLPPGDLKALSRVYADRLLVLQDAARHEKK